MKNKFKLERVKVRVVRTIECDYKLEVRFNVRRVKVRATMNIESDYMGDTD